MTAPSVIRLGSARPWLPPRDFAALAQHFRPDGQWMPLLSGVHYQRGDVLMRRHLARWAREHGMRVQTFAIRDMTDLVNLPNGELLKQQLDEAGITPAADKSPGMLVRFTPEPGDSTAA